MNFLSSNIKFLRKQRKLSQQQLADDLGVKRSNIAAYETKNVEPRLALINEMALYFSVPLEDLVTTDLKTTFTNRDALGMRGDKGLPPTSVDEIAQLSGKIHRMLDGFKVFYEFKKKMNEVSAETPVGDIDNFLTFINHMLEYNRLIENIVKTNDRSGAPSAANPDMSPIRPVAAEVVTAS
ncbi:DNA-binding XRE family transcriptional regulator [Neolewinella xylanilytica]|uniref:DNA-binding XRE family transcriptional regulator n=1 Tax=Neolewinella xylanilytica TaxID=1514080 RepID=A0A2S6I7T3_9BACT|nr:XRE family transcriptional regulator [Neolewinella xylanilytica]PPK87561.1 DNA-binding XRE family transcriptional regulator [Neolewinella xylanilytica]